MLKPYDVEQAAAEIPPSAVTSKQPRLPRKPKVKKLFVLDTNVLMHDPTSLFHFEEHDVYLPISTLEELDSHKRGMSASSLESRPVCLWTSISCRDNRCQHQRVV